MEILEEHFKKFKFKNSINDVINYNPLTVENLDIKLVKEIMEKNKIQQIPIINKKMKFSRTSSMG